MTSLVGYARVSTTDQDAALQHAALDQVGVVKTFTDTISGARAVRPELTKALEYLREGDTLVVWKLDRLGRSLRDLIDQVDVVEQRGVGFRSLTEAIDTTTPGGRMVFHVFGALAEFERDLIRERTRAGLAVARANGRRPGPKTKMTRRRVQQVHELAAQKVTYNDIAETLGVSRTTIARALAGHYDSLLEPGPASSAGPAEPG